MSQSKLRLQAWLRSSTDMAHHPQPETEWAFDKRKGNTWNKKRGCMWDTSGRAWKFDYAWPDRKLALEYEGFGQGHLGKVQYSDDCEKYSEAAVRGWCVIRVTALMVESGLAFDLIRKALATVTPHWWEREKVAT